MKKHYLLILLLAVFFKQSLFAEEEMVISDYSYHDGLTTNIVNSTFRDSRGFLWICSINGLYRYDGYNFQKISSKDKILNCEVLHVTEDYNHNLWIATAKRGVVFYNTHLDNFFRINLDVQFSFNINKILIFKKKIWLATDSGLIVFDYETEFNPRKKYTAHIILPESANPADQRNRITSFYVHSDSVNLWIGTNGGLFVLNTNNFMLKGIASHPQNAIRVILPFSNNQLIVGSWDGGVFGVDSHTLTVTKDPLIEWINQKLYRKRVISASYDPQHRLWIATYGDGLYCFDLRLKDQTHFSCRQKNINLPTIKSDIINHIQHDNDGILWISMNQPALTKIYYQKSKLQAINFESADQPIEISCMIKSNVFPDNVWIGTTRNGIFQYNLSNNTFKYYSTSANAKLKLPSNEISLLYEDKQGNLWLVHRILGLYVVPSQTLSRLSHSNNYIYPIEANNIFGNFMINSYITTFYEDSKGRLWIGLWGSLYMLNFKPEFKFARNSTDLKVNTNAVCLYKDDEPQKTPFPISPTQAIIEIQKGKYYVGTRDEGIIEINEIQENVFTCKLASELNPLLPSESIRCFYKTQSGILWIGTNTGACAYNPKNKQIVIFNEHHGLTSENINHIYGDVTDNVWVSTSFGISHIALSDMSVKNYLFDEDKNALNHLISSAAAQLPNGHLVFSTNKAIVSFHPDSLKDSIRELPLYFTNVKINNELVTPSVKINGRQILTQQINESKIIKVPYKATISLEFAAIDFISHSKIKYKYRINGNEWIALERNQRSINFYNQNPGEYQLQLLAQHPSGFTTIRTIQLNFLPPWWKTTWAYMLYFIILFTLFVTYRNLILQRIHNKARLEQEQFEKAKIQELDKLKTNFITNLAHEIRTPLSLIINPLENLAKSDKLTYDAKEKIHTTLKNSYRLMKLTNELSDYTRIEKELIRPEFKNYDLIEIINEVIGSFTAIAETMAIDFQFYSAFKQLTISFDKEMLEKVIFNLLSNAFKFTPKNGSIVVEIVPAEWQEKNYVKITVTNTGEGIPQDKIDKIFDRFYQIDSAQQGLGIGLSIVKSLVELHDGLIKVRSIPGAETSFEVYIPFRQTEQATTPPSQLITFTLNKIENNISKVEKPSYKLLIVEDDDEILAYLAKELSSSYKVYTATNGHDGLQIARNIIPDIIITDVVMPGINGIELCKQIRNSISTSHIPIVILSAKTNVEQQVEGLDAGANIYMIKPFHIQLLRNQIDQLIHLKETIYKKFIKESALVPEEALDNNLDKQFLEKVLQYIESNLSNTSLNVDELANHVFLSKVQLYRKIKSITGLSVIEFITSIRLKKAAQLILERRLSFAQIAYETGFSSPSYFTKCFREHFGKTPSEYLGAFIENEEIEK